MTTTDTNNNTNVVDTLELDPADGQQYVVELRDRLLELLSTSQTIEDIENRLLQLYPDSKLVDLAIRGARKTRNETHQKNHKTRHHSSSSSSASFTGTLQNITSFAVAKVSSLVREGVVGKKSENEVTKFKMAIIEFIIKDVLDLAGNFVRRQKGNFIITRSDIRTAMYADKDLLDLFLSDDKSLLMMDSHSILAQICGTDRNMKHYPFAHHHHYHHHHHNNNDHDQYLSNKTYKQKVIDMVDIENEFIRGLKIIIKVFKAQLEELPHIRKEVDILFCNIDELLELSTLLLTTFEDALESVEQEGGVPYVGSEIFDFAQAEEFHAYLTFAQRRLSRGEGWRQAYLSIVTNESTMISTRTAGQSFDLAVKHLLPQYLLNTITHFFKYFNNFSDLYELSKEHENEDDRLALKETISILIKTKKAIEDLVERELDQKELEPLDPEQAKSIKAILDRRLDAELQHERNLPLPYMPPQEIYRFSEPDSKDNIQFEEMHNNNNNSNTLSISNKDLTGRPPPVIRCATLIKLVERLTYHKYQPNIVDSFLTTYRSFISDPEELLDLLIERFKIPDPPLYIVFPNFFGSFDELPEIERTFYKQYLKRFRQEYSKPVKMRVINVFKSWIKNHYYDFERHPTLLGKLESFLNEIYCNDKVLRKLIVSIQKSIEQKRNGLQDEPEFMLSQEPPPILWWSAKANEPEKFDILTLHPVEIARQLTLVEFDLFRAIKPSELINVCDLNLKKKEGGYDSSPNLSRLTRHFTFFSYWIRKCIVEVDDFDKRSAIYNRAIEIAGVLRELNNFTGLLSIGSAIQSAPIERLSHTKKTLTHTTMKIMDDYNELMEDHQKKLQSELKKCNPPCIPYLGSYQTKLIHAKEGNKTFIDEATTSPTLSNDEFLSSFSNSPATPISPRTPLSRATLPHPPSSASSVRVQNQFFGGSIIMNTSRPLPISLGPTAAAVAVAGSASSSSGGNNNCGSINLSSSNESSSLCNSVGSLSLCHSNSTSTLMPLHQPHQPHQPLPLTPGPPKMINFTKQRIRAGLVAEISNYQNPPYCLQVQQEIREFIESIESRMTKFAMELPKAKNNTSKNDLTTRLDDYLFEQSEKIEPKNCTKPPRSKSKLPDHWKSPGIKVNNCTTPK